MDRAQSDRHDSSTYAAAGVDSVAEETGLESLLGWVGKSLGLRQGLGASKLPIGYFAAVVDIGHETGLAISTDGVGTKLLVAQMMNKYDTVGIDCVAMNVNDVLCVGAEPVSLVDCISVQEANPYLLAEIGKGLYEGARLANVTIPGGEIAQIRDIIKGVREGYGFDLVGTCVGLVPLSKVIIGQDVQPGDVVVGLRSSGIHSNGLTLARDILFKKRQIDPNEYVPELGRAAGEEILEPTRIYVAEVVEMLRSKLSIKALIHVTGDGFLNLTRVAADVGFVIDSLPPPHPVFTLIQRWGQVADEEMFRVFNMGIGFCVVTSPGDADAVVAIAQRHGVEAFKIGHATADPEKKIVLPAQGLIGKRDSFYRG